MVAYLLRMDTGYAGSMTREPGPGDLVQEKMEQTVDWSPYDFGTPVVYTPAGAITPISSSNKAEDICGLTVRSFPGRAVSNTGRIAYPTTNGDGLTVARRGFIAVALRGAAPSTKGAPVYVRIATPGEGTVIGGFEAAADGSNTVELPNSQFEGAPGADGVVEISFTIL